MKIVILFNLVILIFCLSLWHKLVLYRTRILFTEYRFKMFALRDELARLVAENVIQEDSETYEFLIKTFNTYILYLEKIDLLEFIKRHIILSEDPKYLEDLQITIRRCRESHPEVKKIMRTFESSILNFLFGSSVILQYLSLLNKFVNYCKVSQTVKNRIERINTVITRQQQTVDALA